MLTNLRTLCIFFFYQKHLLHPASMKVTSTFWISNFAVIYSGKINIRVIFAVDEIQNLHGLIFMVANSVYVISNKQILGNN